MYRLTRNIIQYAITHIAQHSLIIVINSCMLFKTYELFNEI
jgi:hypothetical protein